MIRLDNLTLTYDRHPAVHHLSGQFRAGSLTAIVGPNGAGKSTLLKAIAGLLAPSSGKVERSSLKKGDIAYLPQQAEIDRSFPLSVFDMVLMGRWKHIGSFGGARKEDLHAASHALEAVGLAGFERRMLNQLSAGQMQRVLFARLMVQDAAVILLDEPFNAIDARTTADLLTLVTRWHSESRTVIAVLHDYEQVRSRFPETLLMARECLAWGATESVLTPANLLKARARSEAWDEDSPHCHQAVA